MPAPISRARRRNKFPFRHALRSFRVRQLAAAFLPASLLAGFQPPGSPHAGLCTGSASKLAREKTAASCRTLKLRRQHSRDSSSRGSKRGIRSRALEKRQNSPPFLQITCALVLNIALFSEKMSYVPLFSYTYWLCSLLIEIFFFHGLARHFALPPVFSYTSV